LSEAEFRRLLPVCCPGRTVEGARTATFGLALEPLARARELAENAERHAASPADARRPFRAG
jgi:hypothetical protein